MRTIECCCTSLYEAREAKAGGAARIELCEDLSVGGVTPSRELIRRVVEEAGLPVNVLVRPRGGDFVFNDHEVNEMLESIAFCHEAGVNAVVIGALDANGDVDMPVMRRLIEAAGPLPVTFHRAFDCCRSPIEAFEDIRRLGCARLLTSGHESNAWDGRELIRKLVGIAGQDIIVMPGCGVRTTNIAALDAFCGASEYHSTSHGTDGRTDRGVVAQLCSL